MSIGNLETLPVRGCQKNDITQSLSDLANSMYDTCLEAGQTWTSLKPNYLDHQESWSKVLVAHRQSWYCLIWQFFF